MLFRSLALVTLGIFLMVGCASAPTPTSIPPTALPTVPAPTLPPTSTTTAVPPATVTQVPSPVPTKPALAFQFVWSQSTKQAPIQDAGVGAVDAHGNIYALTAADQIVVLDPEGRVVRTIGEHGSGEGQFNYYQDIS